MRKNEKIFYIIVFILFFLFIAIITYKDGFLHYPLFKMNRAEIQYEGYSLKQFNELRKHMIVGAFNPQLVFEITKDLSTLPIILLTLLTSIKQINLKNRYYVYIVGRQQGFFMKYLKDGLKKMIKTTFAVHMAFVTWLLICFFISGKLDLHGVMAHDSGVQTIDFIEKIHRENHGIFLFIMAWIPNYIFTGTIYLITMILYEIVNNRPIVVGLIISYLYLTSQIMTGLGYFHLGPITPLGILTLVEVPYQYIFVPLLFSLLILVILSKYRRIMKIDEL